MIVEKNIVNDKQNGDILCEKNYRPYRLLN